MYVDTRWELKLLGEEGTGVLVETPDGEQLTLATSQLENYARVGNKLIPKNNVNWL